MTGWDGFAKYVGIQGVLALAVTITIIVITISKDTVPAELWSLVGVSWGFYFAKNGYQIANIGKTTVTPPKEGE